MKQKILHWLLALLVAFGIWVYVVTVVSPDSEATYYNIPVVLNNESVLLEKGLMVVSGTEPTVTLQLRGNRSDLNNLKNSDITVVADLSKINSAGQQTLTCNVSFTGNESNNAFEILNQNSRQITLQIVEWSSKEIPVNVIYSGTLGLDYIAYKDEAILDRKNISITGPKSVVDQITQAVVEVDLNGQVQTIAQSYRYTLCDKDGEPVDAASIRTDAAEVNLTLKIQRVKEIQLVLNVAYGGGATVENTTIALDQQTIKISGSEKLLEDLSVLVVGTVNLAEIAEDTEMTFPITLPEGVENLTGISNVKASVTFTGLATKTLEVSKIFASGTPTGMNYDIVRKVISVTVRGPEELIERIEAENITVLVDLSNAEPGEDRYNAVIVVDPVFDEVEPVGSYKVEVSLTRIPEDGE